MDRPLRPSRPARHRRRLLAPLLVLLVLLPLPGPGSASAAGELTVAQAVATQDGSTATVRGYVVGQRGNLDFDNGGSTVPTRSGADPSPWVYQGMQAISRFPWQACHGKREVSLGSAVRVDRGAQSTSRSVAPVIATSSS